MCEIERYTWETMTKSNLLTHFIYGYIMSIEVKGDNFKTYMF